MFELSRYLFVESSGDSMIDSVLSGVSIIESLLCGVHVLASCANTFHVSYYTILARRWN